MAFLSVAFITSSLAAASPAADVVLCMLRPSFPVSEIYINPYLNSAPLVPFSSSLGPYLCTRPFPRSYLSRGVSIRYLPPGAHETVFLKADARVYDLNRVSVARLAYVLPDENRLEVVYAAWGVGYIVVDENVPKRVARTYVAISGDAVFLNPDPVLRIYLRAERGKLDVRHYAVDGFADENIPSADVSLRFAACSLRVADFSTGTTQMNGEEYLTGRFRVLDDQGAPLLVPNLRVYVGDQAFSPQYSSADMFYTFFAPYDPKIRQVRISADVPGCSHFEHVENVSLPMGPNPYVVALVAVAVVALALYFWRRR